MSRDLEAADDSVRYITQATIKISLITLMCLEIKISRNARLAHPRVTRCDQ